MQIEVELLFKLFAFLSAGVSYYFLLRNSVNILAERQSVNYVMLKAAIEDFTKYKEKQADNCDRCKEKNLDVIKIKTEANIIRIENVEEDLDKIDADICRLHNSLYQDITNIHNRIDKYVNKE